MCSMEAEARALLAAEVSGRRPPHGLGSFIRDQFAEIGGVDLESPPRDGPARAVDFSDQMAQYAALTKAIQKQVGNI